MGYDEPTDESTSGMDRRKFLQRAAVVSGATLWAAPTVQSIMAPAFAVGTGLCPPGHLVAFKYDVDTNEFDSGNGDGVDWCLPDGYADADKFLFGPGNSITFDVDGTSYTISISIEDKTATVTLPPGARIEDLQAKAGNKTNGECDDFDSHTGTTAKVTLEDKGISFVAGVICV